MDPAGPWQYTYNKLAVPNTAQSPVCQNRPFQHHPFATTIGNQYSSGPAIPCAVSAPLILQAAHTGSVPTFNTVNFLSTTPVAFDSTFPTVFSHANLNQNYVESSLNSASHLQSLPSTATVNLISSTDSDSRPNFNNSLSTQHLSNAVSSSAFQAVPTNSISLPTQSEPSTASQTSSPSWQQPRAVAVQSIGSPFGVLPHENVNSSNSETVEPQKPDYNRFNSSEIQYRQVSESQNLKVINHSVEQREQITHQNCTRTTSVSQASPQINQHSNKFFQNLDQSTNNNMYNHKPGVTPENLSYRSANALGSSTSIQDHIPRNYNAHSPSATPTNYSRGNHSPQVPADAKPQNKIYHNLLSPNEHPRPKIVEQPAEPMGCYTLIDGRVVYTPAAIQNFVSESLKGMAVSNPYLPLRHIMLANSDQANQTEHVQQSGSQDSSALRNTNLSNSEPVAYSSVITRALANHPNRDFNIQNSWRPHSDQQISQNSVTSNNIRVPNFPIIQQPPHNIPVEDIAQPPVSNTPTKNQRRRKNPSPVQRELPPTYHKSQQNATEVMGENGHSVQQNTNTSQHIHNMNGIQNSHSDKAKIISQIITAPGVANPIVDFKHYHQGHALGNYIQSLQMANSANDGASDNSNMSQDSRQRDTEPIQKVVVPNIEEELEFLSKSSGSRNKSTSTISIGSKPSTTFIPTSGTPTKFVNHNSANAGFMSSYLKFLSGERDPSSPPSNKGAKKVNKPIQPPAPVLNKLTEIDESRNNQSQQLSAPKPKRSRTKNKTQTEGSFEPEMPTSNLPKKAMPQMAMHMHTMQNHDTSLTTHMVNSIQPTPLGQAVQATQAEIQAPLQTQTQSQYFPGYPQTIHPAHQQQNQFASAYLYPNDSAFLYRDLQNRQQKW